MSGVRTEHSLVVGAPAENVYRLIADTPSWPVVFGPCVHVERQRFDGNTEQLRLWALVNDEVKTWTSRRVLDPGALRIDFEQERSQAPIASMGGAWILRPLADDRCEIVLEHHFTAVDGDSAALDWIGKAVDANSERELAALARLAEFGEPLDQVVFSFEDQVELPGALVDAYTFIDRADRWPSRLPHVGRLELTEEPGGVQRMEMDTVTADGSAHTTSSIRLCFPHERIVYKQLLPPALLLGHSGVWEFTVAHGAVKVTARHRVAVDVEAIPRLLGTGSTLADARKYLREALGANSRATLAVAAGEGVS